MRKTTVYLREEELEGLRRLSVASGESQAELIRRGVRRLLEKCPERVFHSMGKGVGTGEARPRWNETGLRDKNLGRR